MGDENREINEEIKDTSMGGLAMELLQEVKAQTKRWVIAFFVMCIVCVAEFFGFMWYLSLYDFESSIEQTGLYTYIDSDGNVISSDLSADEMKSILEAINGGEAKTDAETNEK